MSIKPIQGPIDYSFLYAHESLDEISDPMSIDSSNAHSTEILDKTSDPMSVDSSETHSTSESASSSIDIPASATAAHCEHLLSAADAILEKSKKRKCASDDNKENQSPQSPAKRAKTSSPISPEKAPLSLHCSIRSEDSICKAVLLKEFTSSAFRTYRELAREDKMKRVAALLSDDGREEAYHTRSSTYFSNAQDAFILNADLKRYVTRQLRFDPIAKNPVRSDGVNSKDMS